MKTYTATDLKQNISGVFMAATKEPIIITRHNKGQFVLINLEDYERLTEKESDRSCAPVEMLAAHVEMADQVAVEVKHEAKEESLSSKSLEIIETQERVVEQQETDDAGHALAELENAFMNEHREASGIENFVAAELEKLIE